MAQKITDEIIEYVGILAQLEIQGQEKEQIRKDMEQMLDYVDRLNQLDTEGIEPMSHVFPVTNVFREDKVENKDQRDHMLANAPASKDGAFQVPRTIE